MASFESEIIKLDGNVWSMGFEVPPHVVDAYKGKEYKRVICQINGSHEYYCALMPKGEGRYFVNVNKDIQKKLRLNEGDRLTAEIRPDDSKYGLPMPEELQQLLALDKEGDKVFHSLTPGKQRNLIHIVSTAKRSETRIKKALTIVEYLKEVSGKLDFKELNRAFKNANKG